MAENKKSFVLYADLLKSIEHLTNEEKGILFNHLLEYVNDKNPILTDRLILTAWKPIELQLKRDLIKWDEKTSKYSEAGVISAKSKRLQVGKQVYILKVTNDIESFIKVGVTDDSVSRRFSSKDTFKGTDYKFEILHQVFCENPSVIENEIMTLFKNKRYVPYQKFCGHTECYNFEVVEQIIKKSTSFNVVQQSATNPTVNDTVNVNVNDTVNVNDIKENNKTALPFKFFDSLISLGADKQLTSDWISVRKLKKLSNTLTAFNGFKNELDKSGKGINEVLNQCVINSWGGFKSEWIKNKVIETIPVSGEKMIKYISNVNPTPAFLEESKFLAMQERNLSGGYIYTILP